MTKEHDPLNLKKIFTMGPSNEDHFIGLRCAAGVFLPLFFLLILDRLDLAIFAVFGAFVNVYGRVPRHLDRLLAQLKTGALFWILILVAWFASSYWIEHGTQRGLWTVVALTSVVAGVFVDYLDSARAARRFVVPYLRVRGDRQRPKSAEPRGEHVHHHRHHHVRDFRGLGWTLVPEPTHGMASQPGKAVHHETAQSLHHRIEPVLRGRRARRFRRHSLEPAAQHEPQLLGDGRGRGAARR
ncbi:hypothetical protein ACXA45_02530 [Neomicrococcus lactis]